MIELNEQQKLVASQGARVARGKSSNQLYQFSGAAGTGKSVVLHAIMEQAGLSHDEILAVAPTGQASIVMRTKGFPYATTVHSALFTPETYIVTNEEGEPLMDTQFNKPIQRTRFVPRMKLPSNIKAIFIDEARMVPANLAHSIMGFGLPVIATGDIQQLDPVKAKPYFINDPNIPILTQLMRQAEESPIVYLAHRALNNLPIKSGLYANRVLVINREDLRDEMLIGANIILCSTNNTRDKLNNTLRYHYKGKDCSSTPVSGDRVICRKNNWEECFSNGLSLCNGMVGTASRVYVAREKGAFRLIFTPDIDPSITFNVLADSRYIASDAKRRTYLKNNNFTVANLFEYAYASTIHLSQGSEYPSGVVIEEYPFGANHNKLLYTGITRFRQNMLFVKRPQKRYY